MERGYAEQLKPKRDDAHLRGEGRQGGNQTEAPQRSVMNQGISRQGMPGILGSGPPHSPCNRQPGVRSPQGTTSTRPQEQPIRGMQQKSPSYNPSKRESQDGRHTMPDLESKMQRTETTRQSNIRSEHSRGSGQHESTRFV